MTAGYDIAADGTVAAIRMFETGSLRLELPPEPTEVREWLRTTVLAGEDPRGRTSGDSCLGALIWERWRSALEPAGLDRESFVEIIESYGREIWLWIIGDRQWEQCIEGLAGRAARRLARAVAG